MALATSAETGHGASPPQKTLPARPTRTAPPGDAAPSDNPTVAPSALRPGDHVEVHAPGHPPYQAVIDDTMAHLHIAWIRELRCGERRMLSSLDHHFHRC